MLIWSALLDKKKKKRNWKFYVFLLKSIVAQSCLTLCNPMDCNPMGSSVHGILQARILEWVAISYPKGFFHPRDQTGVSCIAGRFFFFLNHLNHQGSPSMRETQSLLSAYIFQSAQLQCLIVFTLGLFLLFSSLGCHF